MKEVKVKDREKRKGKRSSPTLNRARFPNHHRQTCTVLPSASVGPVLTRAHDVHNQPSKLPLREMDPRMPSTNRSSPRRSSAVNGNCDRPLTQHHPTSTSAERCAWSVQEISWLTSQGPAWSTTPVTIQCRRSDVTFTATAITCERGPKQVPSTMYCISYQSESAQRGQARSAILCYRPCQHVS